MDHVRAQDPLEGKGAAVPRYREHSDESADMRPADSSVPPSQDEKRPIRRVPSPSRPRAWMTSSYKPKFGGRFQRPHFQREDHSINKPGFRSQRYTHLKTWAHNYRRDHPPLKPYPPLKPHHIAPRELKRESDKEREKEWYEQRESIDVGRSPPMQSTSRPVLSSRDKDMQFTVGKKSREKDHRATNNKDRGRSRDGELPLTASQTAARDRAIQQKRREIDEVYYQECEMFGLVAKMLIAKDPSLELSIQSSLQENLRDIGKRCVEAMEKFIEEYDSRELLH